MKALSFCNGLDPEATGSIIFRIPMSLGFARGESVTKGTEGF